MLYPPGLKPAHRKPAMTTRTRTALIAPTPPHRGFRGLVSGILLAGLAALTFTVTMAAVGSGDSFSIPGLGLVRAEEIA
ncbi:MAG: hypothetical protein OXU41_01880, partial [Gammaproteobacteria bacterium]|nr:hypothetical protein [Gammaproteobacteria bacterium]